jgi:uncharacterized Rmd1/YagE family protein
MPLNISKKIQIESFERTINYVFKDIALLLESLSYGGQTNLKSNQLIGDGVLIGWAIFIFEMFAWLS